MAVLRPSQTRPRLPLFPLAALAAVCALGLLLAYRSASPGATARGGAAQRWANVPSDLSIPMTLPGWAWQPMGRSQLVDGAVDMSAAWISQFGEDKWLVEHLFYNKRNGFYLEFGAMDGNVWSNTKWLHDQAGWKGMLIEAEPGPYVALAQNRKQDICIGAAVCDDFQLVHYVLKGAVGGIWELMAPEYRKAGWLVACFGGGAKQHVALPLTPQLAHLQMWHHDVDPSTLPEVACVPLMFLLDRFGVSHIDFWSLDVEGAELAVLEAFDFKRVSVDVIVVETDGHNKTKDAAIGALLAQQGFLAVDHGPDQTPFTLNTMDTFFVHQRYLPLRSSAPGITALTTR